MIRVLHRDMETGELTAVATIEGTDLEFAYKATQNGVLSDSWSRLPPAGVTPLGQPYHLIDGKRYGLRSSMVGDQFDVDGKMFVCANIGFKPLPAE